MIYRLTFVGLCITAMLSPVAGQTKQALTIVDVPPAKPITDDYFLVPVDKLLDQAINASISALQSPHYATRNKAVEELVQVGTPALARLRSAYRANANLDLSLAIGDIVRRVYFNHHVFDRNGFLGISMGVISFQSRKSEHEQLLRASKTRHPSKKPLKVPPLLPDQIVGVEIRKVTQDSAAQRVGLAVYDVIYEVDGKQFSAEVSPRDVLSATIRSHRPGEVVILTVQRGDESKVFHVTLGRTPALSLGPSRGGSRIVGTADLYDKVTSEFPDWWNEYFKQQENSRGSD